MTEVIRSAGQSINYLIGGITMDEQRKAEIVPLNQELYLARSIEDLEKRLELSPLLAAVEKPCEEFRCVFYW